MFENVDGRTDGRTTDGRTTDAGVTGILIAHLGAFGSIELKTIGPFNMSVLVLTRNLEIIRVSRTLCLLSSTCVYFRPSALR